MFQNRKAKSDREIAMAISKNSIYINFFLTAVKIAAGILAHSQAMISDGIHSASDVFSTFIVIFGVNAASKKEDSDHPYGHERMESISALLLATVLALIGAGIGYKGMTTIFSGNYEAIQVPGVPALLAALLSIIVKEAMFWYTRHGALMIRSDALMADAWHHRSDAMSSIGSLAGIAGARAGLPILDSIACLVICVFIFKAAFDIYRDAVSKLTDHACSPEGLKPMEQVILKQKGVLSIDDMKTRMFGSKIYIDVEIGADGSQSLYEAHAIAQNVHDAIEDTFPDVKHCMVHVNPVDVTSTN